MPSLNSTIDTMSLVLEHTPLLSSTSLPIAEALGLPLTEDIGSNGYYPPFHKAMMDGYAVRTADAGKTVRVVGEIAASDVATEYFPVGSCMAIMTGAPCPPGTEAVVKKENTLRSGVGVTLPALIVPGQHIAAKGSECQEDSLLLKKGTVVTPLVIATLAAFGIKTIKVFPYPSIAIITTGNELVRPGEKLGAAQIHDSNGPMLVAMAKSFGISNVTLLHADDRLESLERALEQVAKVEIVIFTGGASYGNYDIVPKALNRFGIEIIFHKVTNGSGKSFLFGEKSSQLFFGLQGNPLPCHMCFYRYVVPAIHQMAGKSLNRIYHSGKLTSPLSIKNGKCNGNDAHFILARAEIRNGGWQVTQVKTKSSADIFTIYSANSYITLPPGVHDISGGTTVDFLLIGEH